MFKKIDKNILYSSSALLFIGLFIFFSVALPESKKVGFFTAIFLKQIIAVFLGIISFFIIIKNKKINSIFIRKNSLFFFIPALILQLLVLVPGIGISLKGAKRWINVFGFSIQPSEIFKYALILFLSAIIVTQGKKLQKIKHFLFISGIFILPLIFFYYYIHDIGTLITILSAIFIILWLSKNKNLHLFAVTLLIIPALFLVLYFTVPYAKTRIDNFFHNKQSYQNKQMIYTIGSGKITGRGYGSSLQKYSGLIPEPLGDSIFPVFAEETGFLGSVLLISLFSFLTFSIFKRAKKLTRSFDKISVTAIGVLLVFPAFYNIYASLSLVPLSGMPITFISKGGTSIFMSIVGIALILKISQKKR